MFKYNILSDLKDGSCVTPIRKEGTSIICIQEDGSEIKRIISDFDFAKKEEERGFVFTDTVTSIMEQDLVEEEIVVEKMPKIKIIQSKKIIIEPPIIVKEIPVVIKNEPIIKSSIEQVTKQKKNTKITIETQVIKGGKI